MNTTFEEFSIETDAPVYLPGSTITGRVRLRTNKDVLYENIIIEALGKACCITSNPTSIPIVHEYYRTTKTLLGRTYRTEDGEQIGDQLRFDIGSVPDGGVLHVPVSKRGKRFQLQLIGRWGGKDHILGVARLYPHSLIDNCKSRQRMDMPLTMDGATVTATVQFSASWLLTSAGDCHIFRLEDHTNLFRIVKFDILCVKLHESLENDSPMESIFCQVVSETEEMIEGDRHKLPPVEIELPFAVRLPEHLPSTIDTQQGSSIRYSLTCSLGKDAYLPTAVAHFGVVQPIPSSIPALATARKAQSLRRPWGFWSCGHTIRMTTCLDRSGYAPGEMMRIKLKGNNTLFVPLNIRVDLVRVLSIELQQKASHFLSEFNLCAPICVPKKQAFRYDLAIPFPCVAPTYDGGIMGVPLKWEYRLVVTVEARNRNVLTHNATIIAAALPTELFSEEKGDLIRNSRVEKAPRFSREALVYLGDWEDVVMKEGIESTLKYASDADNLAIRATNKAVRSGKTVEEPFVPFYCASKAMTSNDANER